MEMEFYAYPSRVFPLSSSICSFCIRDFVDRAKDFFSVAVSAIIGSVLSAIFTFFFALGRYSFNLFDTLFSYTIRVFGINPEFHINSLCCFDWWLMILDVCMYVCPCSWCFSDSKLGYDNSNSWKKNVKRNFLGVSMHSVMIVPFDLQNMEKILSSL